MATNSHFLLTPPTFPNTDKSNWYQSACSRFDRDISSTWLQTLADCRLSETYTRSNYNMATSLSNPGLEKLAIDPSSFRCNHTEARASFGGCKSQAFSSIYTSCITDARSSSYSSEDSLYLYSTNNCQTDYFRSSERKTSQNNSRFFKNNCHYRTSDVDEKARTVETRSAKNQIFDENRFRNTQKIEKQLQNSAVKSDKLFSPTDDINNQIKNNEKPCIQNDGACSGNAKEKSFEATEDDKRINKVLDEKLNLNNHDSPNPIFHRSFSDSFVHRRAKSSEDKTIKRRKSVHFADTSGYELEIHIPISQADDYNVPPRLMEALQKIRSKSQKKVSRNIEDCNKTLNRHYALVLKFQQPFLEPTFQRRITQQHVCLESISIIPNTLSFTGVIRVANLEFEKQVTLRCSGNQWKTFMDVPACFVSSLSKFQQDQFSFHLQAPECALHSGKIEIAVRYSLPKSKREFWDNNCRHNYVIGCMEYPAL